MNYPPVVSDFKTQFDRDFPFGTGFDSVRDSDITKALNEAGLIFNSTLFDLTTTTNEGAIAYCYAAAHFLVLNIQQAGGLSADGPRKGTEDSAVGIINSTSIGSVSVNYTLPPSLAENPILSHFMLTNYGKKYLSLLTPKLVGNAFVVGGFDDTGTQTDF